ncbi:hypothetical protein SALBM135S_04021 [Streptomyces alboniger]
MHQREQAFLVLLGQLGEEVGGVVGVHGLQDVGGALLLQLAEDLDLVVLGQLLEDVGEPVVVEGGGHLGTALGGEVVQDVGEVGGAELLEGGEEVLGALPVLLKGEAVHGGPVDGEGLALAPEGAPLALAYEDPVDLPVAARRKLLHRHVEDGHLLAALYETDPAVEHLAEDEPLGGPLLEAPYVEHAGGDDLARLDAGDACHGQEDAAPGRQLDDEAEQPRRPAAHPEYRHEVTDAADLVAVGVEDGDAGEMGHEDPGGACRHACASFCHGFHVFRPAIRASG